MSHDPEFDRPHPKEAPRRGNRLVQWLLILAVGLFLAGLFSPAIRSSREPARRSQCVNNLKQIALALHEYEEKYGALPPARTVDATGRPLHSWRTLILPFLYPAVLDLPIDFGKPWDDPANAAALGKMPPVYQCPSSLAPPNTTTYLAMVGPHACFEADRPRRLAEITNNHDRVLMLIETELANAVPWMAPRDGDEAWLLEPRSNHPGGANAALIDGSVRFVRTREPAAERREITAIATGEIPPRALDSPLSVPAPATPRSDPPR